MLTIVLNEVFGGSAKKKSANRAEGEIMAPTAVVRIRARGRRVLGPQSQCHIVGCPLYAMVLLGMVVLLPVYLYAMSMCGKSKENQVCSQNENHQSERRIISLYNLQPSPCSLAPQPCHQPIPFINSMTLGILYHSS